MDDKKKEDIVCRIISGQLLILVDNVTYVINNPSRLNRLKARELYNQATRRCLFDNILTHTQVVQWLIRHKVWSREKEEQLKTIDKTLDSRKKSLYKSILNKPQQDDDRKVLKHLRKKQLSLLQEKHSLDSLTVEHYAETTSRQFLILSSLTYEDRTLVYNDVNFKDICWRLFSGIDDEILKNQCTLVECREISRSEPWRSYWTVGEHNPFGNASVDLTDEQKTLILYSRMYDNAYKHPEFPGEEIVDDDDLFDGWLLTVKEENKQNTKVKNIDHVHPRFQNADEIYVVADSVEAAKEIDELNTFEGKLAKKRRAAALKGGKQLEAGDMPDTKEKLFIQAQKEMVDKIKGR